MTICETKLTRAPLIYQATLDEPGRPKCTRQLSHSGDTWHLFWTMTMFGREILSATSRKKVFSRTMRVDSALATSTKRSASAQCSSIEASKVLVTSMPGLSTSTTSSSKRRQRERGQRSTARVLGWRREELRALARPARLARGVEVSAPPSPRGASREAVEWLVP